ncbi:helix-turn-helix domain-containing protein [Massilia sp. Bi118]|uniref:helix-turn-helix domain-containing protein n=1 Tax=Massilia sp. Bi118 TaxID=2822346 RepID=UPI001E3C09F3|nr:helix-turn-helix transcriptional regulator [Massilia sp. Bi118]
MEQNIALVFGKVLRKLRLAAGLTQEELGFKAGLQRKYISLLELGAQQPTLTSIYKLSLALNIKPGRVLDMMDVDQGEA